MTYSDEDILAYVDGEMPADEIAALEAAAANDPDLAARIDRQHKLARKIHARYAPIANEPVPERFADLLGVEEAPQKQSASQQLKAVFARPLVAPAASAFASLALGLFFGAQVLGPEPGITGENNLAGAQLARALSSETGNADWTLPITFRDEAGRYCRVFQGAETRTSGLACRTGEGWAVELLTRSPDSAAGGFQLAGSALPEELTAAIDARIEGDPLSPDDIVSALSADWME
ncbi:hypothetical protein [Hyphobacterium sp.]|uniref:hypothetical protein n=1 Tax=Hyphobacterium sp. TaxID=2004662 RepID=UPI003BAD9E51